MILLCSLAYFPPFQLVVCRSAQHRLFITRVYSNYHPLSHLVIIINKSLLSLSGHRASSLLLLLSHRCPAILRCLVIVPTLRDIALFLNCT